MAKFRKENAPACVLKFLQFWGFQLPNLFLLILSLQLLKNVGIPQKCFLFSLNFSFDHQVRTILVSTWPRKVTVRTSMN